MKSSAMKREPKAETAAPERDDIGWRNFPVFEQVLTSDEPPALLGKVEKTCRQLHEIIQSGAEPDKVRAQSVMTAYGRSVDLIRLLTEIAHKAVAQK